MKSELESQINQLPTVLGDWGSLETGINEFKTLFEKGEELAIELAKLRVEKDENLEDEERRLLDSMSFGESAIAISQLQQRLSDNGDIWELLKALYKKGHLEITLRRRD